MKNYCTMKLLKNISLTGMVIVLTCNISQAQLKLYSNGSTSIGSISQPPAGAELQVIGNSVFSASTSAINSSAYIKGANNYSTPTIPDYTWWSDTLTGIFHPTINTVGISIAGKTACLITPSQNIIIDSSVDNGDKLQVNGSINRSPFDIYSNAPANNIYSGINWVNNITTKAWAVKNGGQDEFYVSGNGQAYSYGWNIISDSTLKENVCGIKNGLDKVLHLQGVTYTLKRDAGRATVPIRQMGLIAQAVQRVVPEVVLTNGNGIKTIAYSNMVGLLVEAIKQEDNKVNHLQHELDSCMATNKQMGMAKPAIDNNARLYPCKSCPANVNTTFQCYVPMDSKQASLLVFDMNGLLKKTIVINGKEEQNINLQGGELLAGMYYYSLMVDGNEVDTKKVIITQN